MSGLLFLSGHVNDVERCSAVSTILSGETLLGRPWESVPTLSRCKSKLPGYPLPLGRQSWREPMWHGSVFGFSGNPLLGSINWPILWDCVETEWLIGRDRGNGPHRRDTSWLSGHLESHTPLRRGFCWLSREWRVALGRWSSLAKRPLADAWGKVRWASPCSDQWFVSDPRSDWEVPPITAGIFTPRRQYSNLIYFLRKTAQPCKLLRFCGQWSQANVDQSTERTIRGVTGAATSGSRASNGRSGKRSWKASDHKLSSGRGLSADWNRTQEFAARVYSLVSSGGLSRPDRRHRASRCRSETGLGQWQGRIRDVLPEGRRFSGKERGVRRGPGRGEGLRELRSEEQWILRQERRDRLPYGGLCSGSSDSRSSLMTPIWIDCKRN